jgi:hypothetical protein
MKFMPRYDPHEYNETPAPQHAAHLGPCWVWRKQLVGGRYGRKWVKGRGVLAHVWYYEQAKGPIPVGLEIDHLCRVKQCVNPAHLEAVTRTVNRQRRSVISEEGVRHVRRSGMTATEAAKHLGISVTAASWIVRRLTWKGIE